LSNPSLILASGSQYRLQRLQDAGLLPRVHPANIDESPDDNESAKDLAARLAEQKAKAVAALYDSGLVIGSDQVAEVVSAGKGHILGKAGSIEKAIAQLSMCSGNAVTFYTGLSVVDAKSQRWITKTETVTVVFSELSAAQIEKYVHIDSPIQCAGSFMMERAGIFLFERIESHDPNALIGIPMIALKECLRELGVDIFDLIGAK